MMINKEFVAGVPKLINDDKTCISCLLGKQTRKSFPKETQYRASKPLELIHRDLCGPISPTTPSQKRYVFVLIDDHTRYMWTILLKEKSEVFEKFKKFKSLAEQETQSKVLTLRTDRGGEFLSLEFQEYCEKKGIRRHLTAPHSPQQNGVVERRNRTLLEMTRSILKHMQMPNWYWGEAVRHSTYLINRVSTRALDGKTPYEALRVVKPNLNHLRVFGCVCYARTEKTSRKKLDDKSRVLVHLGTEPGSKAYRLYDPSSKRIIVSRDVVFDETKPWSWNKTEETEHGNGEGESIVEIIDKNKLMEEEENDDINNEEEELEEESQDNTVQLRRSQRATSKPAYLDDYVMLAEVEGEHLLMILNDEPWDFKEAKEIDVWINACKDEIFSIEKNDTWDLVDLPAGVKPIGFKWVFKIKRNTNGSINKYKARLVAKGYVQRH